MASHLGARRSKGVVPAERNTVRLRNLLYAITVGGVRLWVRLEYVQHWAMMTDDACQAAARRAAENGWIAIIGRPDVHTVRMTAEGCRLARQRRFVDVCDGDLEGDRLLPELFGDQRQRYILHARNPLRIQIIVQALDQILDDAIAVVHDGGTHLNATGTQRQKFRGIAPVFDAADAAHRQSEFRIAR